MQTNVILVDEADQQVGTAEKLSAHEQGLLHRAFSVFIFRLIDNEYEVLLQQRAASKYHSANLWTNTCCSHPLPGETVLGAAHRRLQEEFGFTVSLQVAGNFIYKAELDQGLTEFEYDHVLIGHYHDEIIEPNPEEISNYQWVNIKDVLQAIKETPEEYTAWLSEALGIALEQRANLT